MLVLDRQLAAAAAQRPGLLLRRIADGGHLVTYRTQLADGWNKPATQVSFVLPPPYPAAQPDCFYTDPDLRLGSGAMPANTGFQPLDGVQLLWFSWHLAAWLPHRDDLTTYVRFVESRLHDPR